MNKLKLIKITLLIIILVEEIRSANFKNIFWELKYSSCDFCNKRLRNYQLLHDIDYKLCSDCAAHFNDIRKD
ncbi:hypothetical protein BBD66_07865 [Mammaliicoccus sciuri]|nr:hypothetical protein BBD66_07865 [Mammaliicoccus sciuri]